MCNGQASYNGVAMLSREAFEPALTDLGDPGDEQRRVLGGRLGDWRVLNLYVPNGSEVGSDKYAYKLAWLDRLAGVIDALLAEDGPLLVVGDFNIAPADIDVHDPAAWQGSVLVSPAERERLQGLQTAGLVDLFRHFQAAGEQFSWWDYRAAAFRRNRGLRIDLILANEAALARSTGCRIDSVPRGWDKPSDHAPVVAEFH